MTTWRSSLAALGALLALGGCDEAALGGLLGGGAPPLTQAAMVAGDVTLAAPPGFCIDRVNLRPQFALLARCDTLGARQAASDAPIGVISVSVAPAGPLPDLPSAEDLAQAYGLGAPRDASAGDRLILFRAEGPAPIEGMAPTHWRAAARIGEYMLGLTLYGPEGGAAISAEGAVILRSLVARSRAQSEG